MERIDSILSLVSRTGAKLGVLKHTAKSKNFNSISCGGHHHPNSRDIKGENRVLWVLMGNGESEENIFPWEVEKNNHRECNLDHNLNINLKVHGDLNNLVEHGKRNRFLTANWTTEGHLDHWKLSVLWDELNDSGAVE